MKLYILGQDIFIHESFSKNVMDRKVGGKMGGIPKRMKALVAYGIGDYRLEMDYETPICGDDDIIIKTEGCGICAGDLKCEQGIRRFWGDEEQKAYVEPPFIPGHEFVGRVVLAGEKCKRVSDWRKIGCRPNCAMRRMPILQKGAVFSLPTAQCFRFQI